MDLIWKSINYIGIEYMRSFLKKDQVLDQSGQAVTEYILLMAAIVAIYMGVVKGLARIGITKKLMLPMTQTYAAIYQLGHPKAIGFKNGGPQFHPRAAPSSGEGNFRLFFRRKP